MLGMGGGARMEDEERSTKAVATTLVMAPEPHGPTPAKSTRWSSDLGTLPMVSHPFTLNGMESNVVMARFTCGRAKRCASEATSVVYGVLVAHSAGLFDMERNGG
jgi:hypothetical protein